MKKFKNVGWFVGSLTSTMVLVGCASMGGTGLATYDADVSSKTLRVEAVYSEYAPNDSYWGETRVGPGLLFRSTWNDKAKQYRWVHTFLHTGTHHYAGYYQPSFSLIPDHLPHIEKGDIVDVMFLKEQYDYDFDNLKADKVVRLVCKHDDKPCLKKIKAENEWKELTGYPVPPEDTSNFKYTPNSPAVRSSKK